MPDYNLLMLSGDSSIARGIEGAFHAMLERFSTHWRRIDILTPTAPDAHACTLFGNVHIHPAPHHRALQPLFIRQKGAQLLAERDYHLITSHDFGFFYNGIGAWWLLRKRAIPVVSEIHHVEGYPHATSQREKMWLRAAQAYLPFANRYVAGFRVVNADVSTYLQTLGIPAEKIHVLSSLYLDLDQLRPLPDTPKQYDVLFIGRLVSNKGILILIEALQNVVQTHPNTTLAIRGEGALRATIEAKIAEANLHKNVHFLPRTDDMPTLYNRARMLVCASTVEGNPRVTAEAMACGIPVISTPVGVMPHLIQHGETGWLFDWNSDELAEYIRTLLASPENAQRIGDAGRAVVQAYAADKIIAEYATAYHALIQNMRIE